MRTGGNTFDFFGLSAVKKYIYQRCNPVYNGYIVQLRRWREPAGWSMKEESVCQRK